MLKHTLLKQGLIRFGIVLIWSLENLVSSLLLRSTIAGVDGPLENAISQILICWFQLDLAKQATPTTESITEDSYSPLAFRPGSQGRSTGLTSGPSSSYVSSAGRVVKNTPRTAFPERNTESDATSLQGNHGLVLENRQRHDVDV